MDGATFGTEMVGIVRDFVERATSPLLARIEALEAREPPEAIKGDPGEKGETGEPGENGRDCDMEAVSIQIEERVKETVSAAFATLPVPQDGKDGMDCDMAAVQLMIQEAAELAVSEKVAAAIADLPPPEKGDKGDPGEVDMELVAQMLSERVSEAIKAIPIPQDGKDGIGLSDALKDEDGNLVLVMADGTTKNLGRIVGLDGKDGEPGKDGETFTLDDFDVEPVDERTIKLGFVKGEVMHSFELAFPFPIYRHGFKQGANYERGDLVTWGGSLWHCDNETSEKPDGSKDWSLAVRKGRDGK